MHKQVEVFVFILCYFVCSKVIIVADCIILTDTQLVLVHILTSMLKNNNFNYSFKKLIAYVGSGKGTP